MIGRPPGAVHPADGEESDVSVRYKLPMARRSIALLSLLAGLHVAGCTHEVHTAPTNLHDAVVLGLSPEAAWKVLEGGRSVGSVVLYREDSSPNREFYAVHNVHEQDMGQIDSNGRAWRYRPHEDPELVGSGTIPSMVRLILGLSSEAQLESVSLDDLTGGVTVRD